jgi:transposase InsO family protein
LVDFIDKYRNEYGDQSICREGEIASVAQPGSNRRFRSGPSAYYERDAQQRDPARRCERTQWEDYLCDEIKRVWEDNFRVYGARKVWRQLKREEIPAARCTVERLMSEMGLTGAVTGRTKITTMSDRTQPRPPKLVSHQSTAKPPNQL